MARHLDQPTGARLIKLPLNPGSIPEAQQLAQLTEGLSAVRAIAQRETMGAVHPMSQLRALDDGLQRQYDEIARFVSVVRQQRSGAMSADDAVRYVMSLVEHIGTAQSWLEIARPLPRLPAAAGSRQLLSTQHSRQRRERILATIIRRRNLAAETLDQLATIATMELPGDNAAYKFILAMRVAMLCVEVHAAVAATSANQSGTVVARDALEHYRDELQSLRSSTQFTDLGDPQRSDVWTCTAQIAGLLEDADLVREALRHSLEVSTSDVDSYIQALVNSLRLAVSDDERLELFRRLHALAVDRDLGPVFSRERIGRISMLHDVFSEGAATGNVGTAAGQSVMEECFEGRHRWLFARDAPVDRRVVRISSAYQGNGRVAWISPEGARMTSFELPADTAVELVQVTRSPSTTSRPITSAIEILSRGLGLAIAAALTDVPEARLDVAGFAGLLPVMATRVGAVSIGARSTISYLHPLTGSLDAIEGPQRCPDLLILDRSFGKRSARVAAAFRRLHLVLDTTPRIVDFDSSAPGDGEANTEVVVRALASAAGAIFFGHCDTQLARAGATALVLGRDTGLALGEVARLDLRNVQTLVLVACASGQPNPFVGPLSVAHAAALAGARQLVFTLWPITAAQGARFTSGLLDDLASGGTVAEYVAALHSTSPLRAAPFGVMRL